MSALQGRTTVELTKCASICVAPLPVSARQGTRSEESSVWVSTMVQSAKSYLGHLNCLNLGHSKQSTQVYLENDSQPLLILPLSANPLFPFTRKKEP